MVHQMVWNDGCPLQSNGQTCSERQDTDGVHSFRAEAISGAGPQPECEQPRSGYEIGCVDTETVMSSEQIVTDLEMTTNILGEMMQILLARKDFRRINAG